MAVDVVFGSEFQRNVGIRILRGFLVAWQREVEGRHRHTRVRIAELHERAAAVVKEVTGG